jgi:hypothetical protein
MLVAHQRGAYRRKAKSPPHPDPLPRTMERFGGEGEGRRAGRRNIATPRSIPAATTWSWRAPSTRARAGGRCLHRASLRDLAAGNGRGWGCPRRSWPGAARRCRHGRAGRVELASPGVAPAAASSKPAASGAKVRRMRSHPCNGRCDGRRGGRAAAYRVVLPRPSHSAFATPCAPVGAASAAMLLVNPPLSRKRTVRPIRIPPRTPPPCRARAR